MHMTEETASVLIPMLKKKYNNRQFAVAVLCCVQNDNDIANEFIDMMKNNPDLTHHDIVMAAYMLKEGAFDEDEDL